MRLPLPLASYKQAGTRLLNYYMEATPQAKSPVIGHHAPGVREFTTIGTGEFRGAVEWNGNVYALIGETLYSVSPGGVATSMGTIPGDGRQPLTAGRLAVVSASGYYCDGSTVAQITDPDFIPGTDVDFLDNFLLFLIPGSDTFTSSALNSVTDFDALDFAVAESRPDKLKALLVDHGQVILAGEKTIELWWNAGGSGFPFEKIPDGVVELGCLARDTLAPLDNSAFWLASDRTVRSLRDRVPVRVSHHGVEKALESYQNLSAAFSFTYTLEGHLCYVLTVPDEGTWIYDATTQEWWERASLGRPDWAVVYAIEAWGKTWVFDAFGRMGELRTDCYAEWGTEIRKEWQYPTVYGERLMAAHGRFESVVRPGVGLVTGQGSDPQIGLDFSDDGGNTWVSMPTRSLGAMGKYQARQVWTQLGASRDRIYRQWVSDPVPVILEDAVLEVTGGRF